MLNLPIITTQIQWSLLIITSVASKEMVNVWALESAIDVVILEAHLLSTTKLQPIGGAAAPLMASKHKDTTAPVILLHLVLVRDITGIEEMWRR